MNDENLEQHLRKIPAPELPAAWGTEILGTALREARASEASGQTWPFLLIYLRSFFARNPITATALTVLWLLIFLFKTTTPVDPSEKMMIAHFDPNKPVYIVSPQDEILLAELLQDQPDQRQPMQMP
jgi:hypothetical protein